ncbi:MAG: hypothetical protein QY332_06795 [Anaerolineales bacterium]|nr:MAG: hypothetical protein QY332_06795 [Anaerolineales bacterium]
MDKLIALLKFMWVWVVSVALGAWVFLNLPLDEVTWVGKTVGFVICIIVLPIVAQELYRSFLEEVGVKLQPVKHGCITFLLGLVLWNNLPLEGAVWWAKFLLGVILFVAFPLMVQMAVKPPD